MLSKVDEFVFSKRECSLIFPSLFVILAVDPN